MLEAVMGHHKAVATAMVLGRNPLKARPATASQIAPLPNVNPDQLLEALGMESAQQTTGTTAHVEYFVVDAGSSSTKPIEARITPTRHGSCKAGLEKAKSSPSTSHAEESAGPDPANALALREIEVAVVAIEIRRNSSDL